MKDVPESHESVERQMTKSPERKIGTSSDLSEPSDKAGHIRTFDDIAKSGKSSDSIRTFDDIAKPDKSSNSIRTFDDIAKPGKSSDSGKSLEDIARSTEREQKGPDKTTLQDEAAPEIREIERTATASKDIKNIDMMQPEKWKTLSVDEKRTALEHCGKALGKAYDSPEPPLTTKKMDSTNKHGAYGDGYSYHPESPYANEHGVVGSPYGIKMNEEGMDPKTHKQLFGKDPREALKTYGHEFRHSYQQEQAQRYEKGFKVDDPERAKEWSDNFKDQNYKKAPADKLYNTDRERYEREFKEYENQPVERDARQFGNNLANETYDGAPVKGNEKTAFQGDRVNIKNDQHENIGLTNGRHRTYVALKEGYQDVPVNINEVKPGSDGKLDVNRIGIKHASFDKSILDSPDMKNLMQEKDFKAWERGEIDHKGHKYNDYVKDLDRLKESQDFIKQGHSDKEIGSVLGNEHEQTYKRFYETNPIKVDRVLKDDKPIQD